MNSSENRIRILLDTTYLLPVVGVDVEGVEEALTVLEKLYRLGRAEIYYTQFNVFEIMGKLSRIDYDRRRVMLGLKSIREAFRATQPTAAGYLKALELRRKGFKDLIDLLLYTTSKTRRLSFLTRDMRLLDFLEAVGEDTTSIIHEEEFVRKHG
ncbi:PIN domain-containing protein [Pyrodictium abyssi]|uniref:PIN domain-containing protein n=1 Tax=Pyrodictium abyssi TaxID=54256 RepID=A0ABN6ZQA2_9CREN|nr:PIN domain-containing protein [Pyrodictium abyssi]